MSAAYVNEVSVAYDLSVHDEANAVEVNTKVHIVKAFTISLLFKRHILRLSDAKARFSVSLLCQFCNLNNDIVFVHRLINAKR